MQPHHPDPGYAAHDSPMKLTEIPQAIEVLDRTITDLDATVSEIVQRLEPALGASTPHTLETTPDQPWASTHAARLAAQAGQISNITMRLREALDRLQV